ncbi:hypothetical protein NPIL_167821 [Nephila pilipes]|uniref:Uncharacterized protein n=1 Tax=Nephila pilipes TaxID=299642 RepID=A0A8X6TKN8_NEPPI|nr:hypothetical protein NPIL_167821 [Nephila pilipes]
MRIYPYTLFEYQGNVILFYGDLFEVTGICVAAPSLSTTRTMCNMCLAVSLLPRGALRVREKKAMTLHPKQNCGFFHWLLPPNYWEASGIEM